MDFVFKTVNNEKWKRNIKIPISHWDEVNGGN